jgi:ketosteroid isomerase-like protein
MNIAPGNINRRYLALPALAFGLLAAIPASALTADETAVGKAVEAFRAAQAAKDPKALAALCAEELSYSHSDAHIEDKATFVKNATAPTSKVISLDYKDPTIRVVGDAAIVRFHWMATSETVADSKQSNTSLAVLMTWQKQHGSWKLLDRASTKWPS